ncbi:SET domain [Sesbania bispinosa]|nr:SET domain [Sesbania bispinosa]
MAVASSLRLASRLTKPSPFHLFAFSFSTTSPPQQRPPPIRVALTDSVGRAVFATRPIPAGDLIHTAEPAVCHPSPSALNSVCYSCLAKLPTLSTPFCSHNCHQRSKEYYDVEMKANWMDFDNYCRNHGLKYPLLVKRLACMIISGVARSDSLDILQPANLTHEMILEMEEEFTLLRNAFTKAHIADKHIAFALVEAEAAVGNAVYILPSFYNHDCDPNTHIIWIDNAHAKLKALRDIDEG